MRAAKTRGTIWEERVAKFFRQRGWDHAQRRVLRGGDRDRGDISGIAGVVIEAKTVHRIDLHSILAEVHQQVWHKEDAIGAAVIKKRGTLDVGGAYVVMDGETFARLLREAGYE